MLLFTCMDFRRLNLRALRHIPTLQKCLAVIFIYQDSAEHGIDTVDALINLTADEYWESAKQALAIGKQLGKKVILMGTSTGGNKCVAIGRCLSK